MVQRLCASQKPTDAAPLLNVNFPVEAPRGVRATRLGTRRYAEGVTMRQDPRGKTYFWIGGPGDVTHAPVEGSDTQAFDAGYTSVTALLLEATHSGHMDISCLVSGQAGDNHNE